MLTQAQLEEFERWGLLRLPGAMAEARRLCDLVWAGLAAEHGIERDRPETWTVERPQGLKALRRSEPFGHTGEGAVGAAADDLLGAGRWRSAPHWRPFVTFAVPGVPWTVPTAGWHYDRPYDPEDLVGVPGLNAFAFLAPVRRGGGGTLVLAGSHHLVRTYTAAVGGGERVSSPAIKQALGEADPWLRGLWERGAGGDTDRARRYLDEGAVVDGVRLKVVELTGEPGDVVVTNASTLHAPGPNQLDAPRMMLIQLIGRDSAEVG